MFGPFLTLLGLAAALAWAVVLSAGVPVNTWAGTLLLSGAIAFAYWIGRDRIHRAPPLSRWAKWAIVALIGYVCLQLVPLPLVVLRVLSPTRAAVTQWLRPVITFIESAPLAVTPPVTLLNLLDLINYISVFLMVRELGWRWSVRPWVPAMPLLALAVFEAAVGMVQVVTGSAMAMGTYQSHDHYPGFLEMVLPLALMYGVAILRRSSKRFESALGPAVGACVVWGMAALLFIAIVYSLSRGGFLATVGALLFVGVFSIGPKLPSVRWRWISVGVIGVASAAVFVLVPPVQLIERFGQLSSAGEPNGDARLEFWKETLLVMADFRWFGCGLGGFDSAFYKHQDVVNGLRVGWAHNDYLQLLAELGVAGFAVLAAAVAGVVAPVFRGILKLDDEERRLISIGCAGAFVAILLHSVVDFNLYVPANAMTLAWIAGLGSINGLE